MIRTTLVAAMVAAVSFGAQADLFDKNVTPGVIFGTGVSNGSFTTDTTTSGLELALRGKLRHNASGAPENTYNSNGDGTYSFAAGQAFGQSAGTAIWSFEWAVNTNTSGTGSAILDDYTYHLGIDTNSSLGTSYMVFDMINGLDFTKANRSCWDHSIGTNSTTNATDTSIDCDAADSAGAAAAAAAAVSYGNLLTVNSVAQNSWKPSWFIPGFNPAQDGVYNFYLAASDVTGRQVARTDIQIIVGAGSNQYVPEPGSLALVGLALGGLAFARKRKTAK